MPALSDDVSIFLGFFPGLLSSRMLWMVKPPTSLEPEKMVDEAGRALRSRHRAPDA